jgi:hypothetical protein
VLKFKNKFGSLRVKITFQEVRCGEAWTGFIWFRIGKWRALVIAVMNFGVP